MIYYQNYTISVFYICERENNMSKVVLTKCDSYDFITVKNKIKKSIDHLGGFGHFIKKNNKVFIKLNCVGPFSPELGITSHPIFIQAIIKLVKEYTNNITIGDNPATKDLIYTLKKCGLYKMILEENIKIFNGKPSCEITNKKAKYFQCFQVSKEMVDTDVLINVPKLKTHSLTYMSIAQKNLFGFIYGLDKAGWHVKAKNSLQFAETLNDLYGAILDAFSNKKILNICDGIVGIEGDGPSRAGLTKKAGIIIASEDAVSLDRIAVEIVGLNHNLFFLNKIANERSYGEGNLNNIVILGNQLSDFKNIQFKAPQNPLSSFTLKLLKIKRLRNILLEHPVVVNDFCLQCGECINICPPKVLSVNAEGLPVINKTQCIRCWCCMEVCPQNAITKSKRPILGKIFLKHFK